jgi:ABC-type bacteriocin/lantibiotic exporter with double-glycine peptidase domain
MTSTPTPPAPTATPTPTHTPTASATPTFTPLPVRAKLASMNYQAQTLENCGPASVAILLGYYKHRVTQGQVNQLLAPHSSLCEIAGYVPQYQLMGRAYEPVHAEAIRRMLANGIPVIVSQRLEPGSDISHYRVVKGYDDAAREFLADDPLQSKGPNLRISYDVFGRMSSFGGFVPVYPPEEDSLVRSLVKDLIRVRELKCASP